MRVIRHPLTWPALAAVVLVGAACGGDDGDSSSAPPLNGRTFVTTAAADVEGATLVPGSAIRVSFDDEGTSLSAHAGCNSMGGGWSLDGDTLVVGDMFQTQMACEDALMDQDSWLVALLTSGPTLTLAGDTLTIRGEGAGLVLTDRRVADPDRPLVGTRWEVDTLISNEAASSMPIGVVASLTFDDEGRVAVEAGCNTGSASAEIDTDAARIALGPLGLTRMMCEPDPMAVEAVVTSIFDGTVTYTIEADRLQIRTDDDQRGLGLVASS